MIDEETLSDLRSEVSHYKTKAERLGRDVQSLRDSASAAEQKWREERSKVDRLEERLSSLNDSNGSASSDLEDELRRLRADMEEIRREMRGARENAENYRLEASTAQDLLQEKSAELARIKAAYEALKQRLGEEAQTPDPEAGMSEELQKKIKDLEVQNRKFRDEVYRKTGAVGAVLGRLSINKKLTEFLSYCGNKDVESHIKNCLEISGNDVDRVASILGLPCPPERQVEQLLESLTN